MSVTDISAWNDVSCQVLLFIVALVQLRILKTQLNQHHAQKKKDKRKRKRDKRD